MSTLYVQHNINQALQSSIFCVVAQIQQTLEERKLLTLFHLFDAQNTL